MVKVWSAFLFFVFLCGNELHGQQVLHKADSLFAIGQYVGAQELYKAQLQDKKHFLPNTLLKMAYIAELNGDFTQSLYYLTLLSKKAPSEAIYQKMEAIALKNRLSGYNFDDLGYLVLYLKKYGLWLSFFMILVTGYILYELLVKYRKNEHITFVPKAIVVLSLVGLIVFLNLESIYEEGIVSKSPAFLRESPSSASAVSGTIDKGNKVVVLTSRDHWKLVLLNGRLAYIKRDDLLLI